MKSSARLVAALAAALWAGTTRAQAVPFSADMVITMTGEAAESMKQLAAQTGQPFSASLTHKLHVSGHRMRLEMKAGPDGKPAAMISDMTGSGKSYMLRLAEKTYLELGGEEGKPEAGGPPQLLEPGADLCASGGSFTSCKKLGKKTVGGRACQSYEVVEDGETQTLCVDEKLGFPILTVTRSGTTELKNVAEGPQPAKLFAIPPGFKKTSIGQ